MGIIIAASDENGACAPDSRDRQRCAEEVLIFHEGVERMLNVERSFRTSMCFYPMVVML